MAKIKNVYYYNNDPGEVNRVKEEYEFIGRTVRRVPGGIVVLALPPKKVKKKDDKKGKPRAKREEDAPKVEKSREQKPKPRS